MSGTKWMIVCVISIVIGMHGGLSALHAAAVQRYPKAITPLLDAAGGKSVGSVEPGTPLDVLGQSGTTTHVTLHGWSANGYVYAAPDRRIILMRGFSGHGAPGVTRTVEGIAYQAVTVDGWVATGVLVDDVQTIWKSASALLSQKCGSCHPLPAPDSLTASQWVPMMKTQASNAGLDANEAALLTAYLQAHGKQ